MAMTVCHCYDFRGAVGKDRRTAVLLYPTDESLAQSKHFGPFCLR